MQETALHRSPFYTLGATPRDDRRRIADLADDRSLDGDSDACAAARSTLTSPRTRLSAELAWLPGVSPSRASQVIALLETKPLEIAGKAGLPSLARANALSAVFDCLGDEIAETQSVDLILAITRAVESVSVIDVMRDVNEDRSVSGFSDVAADAVAAEITLRVRAFSRSIMSFLDRIATSKIIDAVGGAAISGVEQCDGVVPHLLDQLIDDYALEAQTFFAAEAETIEALLALLRNDAAAGKTTSIRARSALETCLANWKRVAQPIITVSRARGTNHEASASIARSLRSLGVDVFNEHGLLDVSTWLTNLNAATFGEMAAIADLVEEDRVALADIRRQRESSAKEQEAADRELEFEAKLGMFKNQLFRVSKDGISWNGETFTLGEITRARWGAVKKSTNGIPTGTDYVVAFGDNIRESVIQFSNNSELFDGISAHLWKAVAVRIMRRLIEGVQDGRAIRFGTGALKNGGMTLLREKFLSAAEPVDVPWSRMTIWSQSGSFYMADKNDKSVKLALSYMSDPNTHFLEQLIRIIFKDDKASQLTDLFR